MKKHIAIILAAGKGTRMNSQIPKQYLEIDNKPIIYYTIKAFSKEYIDEIILVTGKDDIDYVKKDIVEKYNLEKVKKIVSGGANRYDSVFAGLQAIAWDYLPNLQNQSNNIKINSQCNNEKCKNTKNIQTQNYKYNQTQNNNDSCRTNNEQHIDNTNQANVIEILSNICKQLENQEIYVHIHDGARPCITSEELLNIKNNVEIYKACALAVKVKDTIKIADNNQNVTQTPNREYLWAIHTPQSFNYATILSAYINMYKTLNMVDTKEPTYTLNTETTSNIINTTQNSNKYALNTEATSDIPNTTNAQHTSNTNITDDAMVLENFSSHPLKLIQGNYTNIKITTPEDLAIAKIYLKAFEE